MKLKIIIMSVVAILLIGSVIAISKYGIEKNDNSNRSNLPIVLKEHNNAIAAFRGEDIIEEFPDVVFPSLPEYDRNALKRGITFESMNEVYIAIEDYDG